MIKKTFEELKEIVEINNRLNQTNPTFPNTKLGYAFKRLIEKNINPIFTDFNDELQDVRIDNAMVDPSTSELLYKDDGRSFRYTPEGLKNVMKKIKEVSREWDKKEFEIKPFICSEIPEGVELTDEDKELLEGVILTK